MMRPKTRGRPSLEIARMLTNALLLLVLAVTHASGQVDSRNVIGGLRVPMSVVPTETERSLQQYGESISTQPSAASVASFIDSIGTNDAAFSVIVGQSRILTLKQKIADKEGKSVIAVGDPSVADFQLLPNPKLVRVLGLRPGVTDISFTTADDETVSLEIHATYDISLLEAQLRQLFPDARLRVAQLREHLIVEGEARSNSQTARIIETLEAYLDSMQVEENQQSGGGEAFILPPEDRPENENQREDTEPIVPVRASVELGAGLSTQVRMAQGRIINLIRVPGVQQVLLKVRIAELNRTAVREMGADLLGVDPSSGNMIGTRIGGASISAAGSAALGGLLGAATGDLGNSSTAFGIFPSGDWQIILRALRQNGLVRVLAEPNLIAMSGHRANFLAGGEFPVPIPQSTGIGGNSVTVDFREFGVRLDFLPFVLEEDRIRLSVTPEVSTIDFTLGTTLVAGGDPVPGLNTRRANTTVELKPGQTLAIAGLLQIELGGQTGRIPGLGDLPYLGPFFSNTTHRRVEKELLVLVTPHLVQPLGANEGMPLPGDDVTDPTDKELYLQNQIEGTTGIQHRSTVDFQRYRPKIRMRHEKRLISGPVGFGR